jgi:VWFA-related protein
VTVGAFIAAATLTAAFGAFASAKATPQDSPEAVQPTTIIRVGVDLIRLDASVTDEKGRPVTDLRAEDFRLTVDGKPWKVDAAAFFGRWTSRPADAAAAALAEQIEHTSGRDRSFLFLIDDLNISFMSMHAARRALNAFAAGWNSEEAFLGLRATSDDARDIVLSRNPARFDEAIQNIRYNVMADKGVSSSVSSDPDFGPSFMGSNPALARANRARRIRSLIATINSLRSVPGRKALVFVSEGLSVPGSRGDLGVSSPFDSLFDDSEDDSAVRMIVEVANRASVVIYTLDPSGLLADFPGSGAQSAPSLPGSSLDRLSMQGTLGRLASDTGGLSVYNRNDLKRGLIDVVDDQRSYYLIGFEPPHSAFEKSGGRPRFHRVRLSVDRPGVRVRTRTGFYGITDDDVAKRAPLTPLAISR